MIVFHNGICNFSYKFNSFTSREKIQEFSSPNSRAGLPYGAAEIFSLMQHMGCEPDRASYNILVDAYGKAGFQDGNLFCFVYSHGLLVNLMDCFQNLNHMSSNNIIISTLPRPPKI